MTFQDAELERRICDNHKKHTGQSPAEVNHLSIYQHQHQDQHEAEE